MLPVHLDHVILRLRIGLDAHICFGMIRNRKNLPGFGILPFGGLRKQCGDMRFHFSSIKVTYCDHSLQVGTVPIMIEPSQFLVLTVIDDINIADHIPFGIL